MSQYKEEAELQDKYGRERTTTKIISKHESYHTKRPYQWHLWYYIAAWFILASVLVYILVRIGL